MPVTSFIEAQYDESSNINLQVNEIIENIPIAQSEDQVKIIKDFEKMENDSLKGLELLSPSAKKTQFENDGTIMKENKSSVTFMAEIVEEFLPTIDSQLKKCSFSPGSTEKSKVSMKSLKTSSHQLEISYLASNMSGELTN